MKIITNIIYCFSLLSSANASSLCQEEAQITYKNVFTREIYDQSSILNQYNFCLENVIDQHLLKGVTRRKKNLLGERVIKDINAQIEIYTRQASNYMKRQFWENLKNTVLPENGGAISLNLFKLANKAIRGILRSLAEKQINKHYP
ncbi:MAG: hypothetical protein IBJ00_06830, partial [Alphaproteobacteria bacterium]|nr:hypothetical protein [Alphaproteobacteria bacterium]